MTKTEQLLKLQEFREILITYYSDIEGFENIIFKVNEDLQKLIGEVN